MTITKSKRFTALVLAFFLVLTLMLFANPTASAAIPPVARLRVTNYAYPTKVMNVYTSGTPASGNSVTLYDPSGSSSQSWWNAKIVGTGYYRMELYNQPSLALNYNQATTKCTVYSHSGNTADDYYLSYPNGGYDNLIKLALRGRNLGTSGSGNGAQLYWYLGNPTIEENWVFTRW